MMMWAPSRRAPLCPPLRKAPPGQQPCLPVLLLGIPTWAVEEFGHVLCNDLTFSSASQWISFQQANNNKTLPLDIQLMILGYVDAKSLINITKAFGGTILVDKEEVWSEEKDFDYSRLDAPPGQRQYQAIVVDDSTIYRKDRARDFIVRQYQENNVSVIVMGIEGIFDIGILRESFGVDWHTRAYTKRIIALTQHGKRILGSDVFPSETQYTKALYVEGQTELFHEHIDPAD